MRIFATSDLHVDYPQNRKWIAELSEHDYTNDCIIIAGDISHRRHLLIDALSSIKKKFAHVFFVPGNHDLWHTHPGDRDSFESFSSILGAARDYGITVEPAQYGPLSIVPLFGWYDFSFGEPEPSIFREWADFSECSWPENYNEKSVTDHFHRMNAESLSITNDTVITFSHFMPRIDLMPHFIPGHIRRYYPMFGSVSLEGQIRSINPDIHLYGHSHLNRDRRIDGIRYINNAFGYPHESNITAKSLLQIYEL